MKRFLLFALALSLAACILPARTVVAPESIHATAQALCLPPPGGESITPIASCTWTTPTPVTPTPLVYGSLAGQVCDKYAAPAPSGADARVMIVSSGMTGGTRTAAQWVAWAQHSASIGVDAYVCDVPHSAAGGVNVFPIPNSAARCAFRVISASSPTGHLRCDGASAGATLADYADATANRQTLTSGSTTVNLDDGTCSIAWSATDAAICSKLSLWSEAGDIRVKNKVNPGSQTNMDQYLGVPGEADPLWMTRATLASPVLWYRAGMAPRLVMGSAGDGVVYPEQTVGTGDPTVGTSRLTCTSVHPALITGTLNAVRAAGPNCTAILNPCSMVTHFPTFGVGGVPITSGECTSDIF